MKHIWQSISPQHRVLYEDEHNMQSKREKKILPKFIDLNVYIQQKYKTPQITQQRTRRMKRKKNYIKAACLRILK